MTNPPTPLSNSQIHALEGCSSISDPSGNLLFYTLGDTVWNKLHQVMDNGTGLFSNFSITHASLIVKKPGSGNIYYVFTLHPITGTYAPTNLYYSVIDMSLASGNGSVTVKNVFLRANCNEKLAAVKHCNNQSVWLLAHEFNSSSFFSFQIDASGVNATPVVSSAGPVETSVAGQMKISPNGKKIGLASNTSQNDRFLIFDFNPATGIVSNPLSLLTSPILSYGCEFSSDGTKFYGFSTAGSSSVTLRQWNLCAGTPPAIVASSYVASPVNFSGQYRGLQLAQNGKIYLARVSQDSISVIQNPNLLGAACNFNNQGFSISPGISKFCFPSFVSSYFREKPLPYTYTASAGASCRTVTFSAPAINLGCSASNYQSISWEFGDPGSGLSNTSSQLQPVHIFSSGGNHLVKLLFHSSCFTDTVKQIISISAPQLTLSGTFSLCSLQTATLGASGANTYTWNTGAQNASISVTPLTSTMYTVSGTNTLNGCSSSKVVTVSVFPCTGIEKNMAETDGIIVSPNPNTGIFYISLSENAFVEIVDLRGISIYKQNFLGGKHEIDISEKSNGVYILHVSQGKRNWFIRLVKQD